MRGKHNNVRICISKGDIRVEHVHWCKFRRSINEGLNREKVHNTSKNMRLMPIEKELLMMVTRPNTLDILRNRFNG